MIPSLINWMELLTAADVRQHNVAHLSQWISTKELRSKATGTVEMRGKVAFLCCDDKATVPVGEPNAPVSTGER